jgi:hypothetical protein
MKKEHQIIAAQQSAIHETDCSIIDAGQCSPESNSRSFSGHNDVCEFQVGAVSKRLVHHKQEE